MSGPFVPPEGVYRGAPTDMRLTLAVGFAGHMSFELIEQHDDLPSVYREMIETRGYGFHHWGDAGPDLDRDVARLSARRATRSPSPTARRAAPASSTWTPRATCPA